MLMEIRRIQNDESSNNITSQPYFVHAKILTHSDFRAGLFIASIGKTMTSMKRISDSLPTQATQRLKV
jgi:hypothetical protein